MKIVKFLSHPVLIVVSFLLVIISGEHMGGFYLLYILMGLPHFSLPSILAVSGVVFILVGSFSISQRHVFLKCLSSVGGAILTCVSLMTFFALDYKGYNSATFEQTVPLVSLVLFGVLVILFTYSNIWAYLKHSLAGLSKRAIHQ